VDINVSEKYAACVFREKVSRFRKLSGHVGRLPFVTEPQNYTA
jgi:hypothetical protein